jgi:hypothetical protein
MPVMTEIRTRETNHGGRSVKISKTESESFEYKPVKTNPPVIQNEINESPYQPQTSPQQRQPIAPTKQDTNLTPAPVKQKTTDKAKNVTRVAHRLGWVNTDNPDEAIKILTEEAEKMNENVYKYLESLAKLGKNVCNEQNPKCMSCPMKDGCKYRASLSAQQKKGLFTRNK